MLPQKGYRLIFAFLLALGIGGISALTACAGETSNETPSPQEEEAPKTETHDKVELQIFAANSLTETLAAVQDLYMEDHDWITFADTQF